MQDYNGNLSLLWGDSFPNFYAPRNGCILLRFCFTVSRKYSWMSMSFYKWKELKSDTPFCLPTLPKYHMSKILLLRAELPLHTKLKDWGLFQALYFRLLVFDQIIAFQCSFFFFFAKDLRTISVCIPFAPRGSGTAPYSAMYKGSKKAQPVLSRFSQVRVSLEVLDTLGTGQAHTSSPALLCREPTTQIDLWGAWPKVSKQGL